MMHATELLETVFAWILRSSWQGAVLVLLILGLQAVLRPVLSARWRHALWGVLILRLLVVWTPPATFSVYNYLPGTPVAVMGALPAPTEALPMLNAGNALPIEEDAPRATGNASSLVRFTLSQSLALAWAAVSALLLLAMVWKSYRLVAQIKSQRPLTDGTILEELEACKQEMGLRPWLAVVESASVQGPALMGSIRPRLLTPPGLLQAATPLQRRHIFLHELAHLKRGDIWSGWLIHALAAVHWFNPLLWWARKRMLADREPACDALVLEVLGQEGRSAYGHTMLDLMEQVAPPQWSPALAGIVESKSNLKRRITMIGRFKPARRWTTALSLSACLVLALVTLTNGIQAADEVDVSITAEDIRAFVAENGGTMIAAKITNHSAKNLEVEVCFSQGPWGDPQGNPEIGRAGLLVPAKGHATKAIPWNVDYGIHTVTVWVDPSNAIEEENERNNTAGRQIAYGEGTFILGEAKEARSTGNNRARRGRGGMRGDAERKESRRRAAMHRDTERSAGRGSPRQGNALIQPPQAQKMPNAAAQCQQNVKQMGLFFKMFANESKGMRYPILSKEPGRLMFAWETGEEGAHSKEYMPNAGYLTCPEAGSESGNTADDHHFAYLSHVLQNDATVEAYALAYEKACSDAGAPSDLHGDIPSENPDIPPLFRIREGIERFLITDINDPAASAAYQSKIPLLIEWPGHHKDIHRGGYVLFMDGHVEYMQYPGKWPMTIKTIGRLRELAKLPPIN
jgi:bla regulator protein blaR1